MSLIINGIDFDKRISDEKRLLDINLRWKFQTKYGCGPYFTYEYIQAPIPKAFLDIKELIDDLIHVCGVPRDHYVIRHHQIKAEEILAKSPPRISFILHELR